MSPPQVLRPVNLLFVALRFLAIVSAVNIGSTRRPIDPVIIDKVAENKEHSLISRDTSIVQPLRHPTLLTAKGNQSSPVLQQWSSLNNGGPIDFKPWSGHLTIRVTRRQNAATIEMDQIYNLQLDCLYKLFNLTAHTREFMLPAKSVVCNTEILSFLSFVTTSKDAGQERIGVPAIVDTLVTIQELTHHLSIQEMDFEFFNLTGPGGDKEPIATGCIAFDDCGQKAGSIPSNVSLTGLVSIFGDREWPTTRVYKFAPSPGHEPSIPLGHFADTAHVFYRTMFRQLLTLPASANLTMLPEPGVLRSPPLHARQMWEGNYYNLLHIVFAQDWSSFDLIEFTLLDLAEVLHFKFRKRLDNGGLKNAARGTYAQMINGYPRPIGAFCVWHTLIHPNLCNQLFSTDGNNHPGGDFGTDGREPADLP